ncbi:MAG TPA: hypothetical protein VG733_00880 [Chthoniobacteraceae bacterium]|nr:hypothetical protein [Chthoniobacteraceae bacterium]
MRSKFLLALGCCMLLGACANIQETGISRSQAITIAKRACPEYPDRFGFVDKAEWVPEKGFWAVLLDDQSGLHGRVYKIDRNGQIVGTRDVDDSHPVGYYDVPPPGYYAPGYYGGPPVVVGVYGPGRYHRRWWY